MVSCTCVVQEGQSPDLHKDEIQGVINSFVTRSFSEEANIAWIPVAPGNGFTAGKPSSSSVVSITANRPLPRDRREALLRELVALWTENTDCSEDEIVAVVSDPTQN